MFEQDRELTGKVAAITGGARGIGLATARALTKAGMHVAIGDLDLDLAKCCAQEIGCRTVALPLDVTDRDSFERFVEEAETALGPLDVLVNNAGIMPLGPFADEDSATTRRMLEINCHGVLYGTQIAVRRFTRSGGGHLVNVASAAGKAGLPGGATYSATKHFVVGLSEAVRLEVRGTGVEVSCVMPVVVNTELGSGVDGTPFLGKVEPEDVAAAILCALRSPRFDVYVPRRLGVLMTATNALPRAVREGMSRLLRAERALAAADPTARAGYEARVAHSTRTRAAGHQKRSRAGR